MQSGTRFMLALGSLVLLAVGFVIGIGMSSSRPPTVLDFSRRNCTSNLGTIVESGLDDWWFCCGSGACISCTGEGANNCEVMIVGEEPGPEPERPEHAFLLTVPPAQVAVPDDVWESLDPRCQAALLQGSDPGLIAECGSSPSNQ